MEEAQFVSKQSDIPAQTNAWRGGHGPWDHGLIQWPSMARIGQKESRSILLKKRRAGAFWEKGTQRVYHPRRFTLFIWSFASPKVHSLLMFFFSSWFFFCLVITCGQPRYFMNKGHVIKYRNINLSSFCSSAPQSGRATEGDMLYI